MPTPPKPHIQLVRENKSHRTKSELAQRKTAEAGTLSGEKMREHETVKNNPIAHKIYIRIKKLLTNIEKNDAIYEVVINRYCILQAECQDYETQRDHVQDLIDDLKDDFENIKDELTPKERTENLCNFMAELARTQNALLKIDNQIQRKRKMLLDIEKENIFTIAAALRSIPKKPTGEKSAANKLRDKLSG